MSALKARAAVLTAPRTVEIQTFDLPKIGKADALLRVTASGVCGADYPVYTGAMLHDDLIGMEVPVVLGHEITGEIVEMGDDASLRWGVEVGDRVVIERQIPCGHCDTCLVGLYRRCARPGDSTRFMYGATLSTVPPFLWGGYADYVYLHPDSVVYKIGDAVSDRVAPLFTPLANAITWVHGVGGVGIGDSVVIHGPGQEGLAAVIAAREAGAGTVVVTGLERDAHRLDMALELGASATVVVGDDADVSDVSSRILEATKGELADVVLDLSAGRTDAPFLSSLDVARSGGTIVLPALHDGVVAPVPIDRIMEKTLTIRGARGRSRSAVFSALKILGASRYPFEKLCSHDFPLERTEDALQMVGGEVPSLAFHVAVIP